MIESPTEKDLPEIRALLDRLQLPLAGVDGHLPTILVAKEGEHTSVRASVEFQSACPASSAIVMRKQLR